METNKECDIINVSFERIEWLDQRCNPFTTIVVFGLFYTFTGGEVEDDIIYTILERIEWHKEDNAQTEMSNEVFKVTFKEDIVTPVILN